MKLSLGWKYKMPMPYEQWHVWGGVWGEFNFISNAGLMPYHLKKHNAEGQIPIELSIISSRLFSIGYFQKMSNKMIPINLGTNLILYWI